MCDLTGHIHHSHVSLSLENISSESMRYKEFHTILLSKIKHEISVTVSPVQNLPQRRLQLTSTQLAQTVSEDAPALNSISPQVTTVASVANFKWQHTNTKQ